MRPSSFLSTDFIAISITKFILDLVVFSSATKRRFYLSCQSVEYAVAKTECAEKSGELLTTPRSGSIKIAERAVAEHRNIWINKDSEVGEVCFATKVNGGVISFPSWNCSLSLHYVCNRSSDDGRDMSLNNAFIPCQQTKTLTSTLSSETSTSLPSTTEESLWTMSAKPNSSQERTEVTTGLSATSTTNSTSPHQHGKTELPPPTGLTATTILAIAVGISVPVLLAAIIITVTCIIRRRSQKAETQSQELYDRFEPFNESNPYDVLEPQLAAPCDQSNSSHYEHLGGEEHHHYADLSPYSTAE